MKFNTIISNILESNKEICPCQIDVVIIGKQHHRNKKDDEKKPEPEEDDDDDNDDSDHMNTINALMQKNEVAALANKLPSGTILYFHCVTNYWLESVQCMCPISIFRWNK